MDKLIISNKYACFDPKCFFSPQGNSSDLSSTLDGPTGLPTLVEWAVGQLSEIHKSNQSLKWGNFSQAIWSIG